MVLSVIKTAFKSLLFNILRH